MSSMIWKAKIFNDWACRRVDPLSHGLGRGINVDDRLARTEQMVLRRRQEDEWRTMTKMSSGRLLAALA